MPSLITLKQKNRGIAIDKLMATRTEAAHQVDDEVARILAQVREGGDAAVLDLVRKFDKQSATSVAELAYPQARLKEAFDRLPKNLAEALQLAANRIADFHTRQLPKAIEWQDATGSELGMRYVAVDAAGLYTPGGTAAYPSSLLMNAIPARIAGVKRRVLATPASNGKVADVVLAAAYIADITEVWLLGGAQAIAVLAYGSETIKPVDVISGPGNAYVAAAKQQVFGRVGIDAIAGPSEVMIIADRQQNPDWVAADLMAQAEHDALAQAILVTDDEDFATKVAKAVNTLLPKLPRQKIAAAAWGDYGGLIVVADWHEAVDIANRFAPEHLHIALDKEAAKRLMANIRHAGAIFLGSHTPEAVGDYTAGANHILPTGGAARFASGLGVEHFMKRINWLACDAAALQAIGPAAETLARAEGLAAHAISLNLRLQQGKP